MAASMTYEQYLVDLKKRLNFVELLTDMFSGKDERLDTLIKLQIELINLIALTSGKPPEEPLAGPLSVITPNRDTWMHGQVNVPVAGTAVQMPRVSIPEGYPVTIIAWPSNIGTIYLANNGEAVTGSTRFDGLAAGLAGSLRIKNLGEVWITSTVNNEGVSWAVEA